MTLEQLTALLLTLGIPVAYSHFDHPQKPPFAVFYLLEDENMSADDGVYFTDSRFNVELYTRRKDPALERRVQRLLRDNGLYWEKAESFIESEGVYEVLYQI